MVEEEEEDRGEAVGEGGEVSEGREGEEELRGELKDAWGVGVGEGGDMREIEADLSAGLFKCFILFCFFVFFCFF